MIHPKKTSLPLHLPILSALLLFSAPSSPLFPTPAIAQDYLPPSSHNSNERAYTEPGEYDYRAPRTQPPRHDRPSRQYRPRGNSQTSQDYYGIPDRNGRSPEPGYRGQPRTGNDSYRPPSGNHDRGYNEQPSYAPRRDRYDNGPDKSRQTQDRNRYGNENRPPYRENEGYLKKPEFDEVYSEDEITNAGHRFFGKITVGLARVIARAFKRNGRPNGYILGEDGSGAFIGGLRYGEGKLFTKKLGEHKIYWQGPSIGYDFGASGNKTMTLVYNLKNINFIYQRFGGVSGSAYLVGGASITLQKRDDVTLAPIRTGVGLRLGANIGYLKYTRRPTWNPF